MGKMGWGRWDGMVIVKMIVVSIFDLFIIVIFHNLLLHFITLQDHCSDTMVIGDNIEESDSATFSVITVCEENTMPATV